ncbi:L-aspartate oxidase [Propionibacterium cyclohexanicum]|uniref:L-aspartate oxidase n=1 Tax=Propionibacterium cyclohexanicum TaxID=64702 RepID=A0A1H9SLJ7_9ACTN|nr:FAD-binding protein [Propionibacterium cyclohexanicum]SER85862.1 L-aspartate oxidase [Propionibacterium cyclohexanicum]
MATTTRLARQIRTPEPSWTRHTGVVIVGAGAAGLSVAARLLGSQLPAVLVSRQTLAASATSWSLSQGTRWRTAEDIDAWVAQTGGLADRAAAQALLSRAPEVFAQLDSWADSFDTRHADPRQPAGTQLQRTLSAVVRTGAAAPASNLRIDTDRRAVDVLTDGGGHVAGLRVLGRDGLIGDYLAPVVVLASGGAGQLWSATTAPRSATGDGLAMALRAGAALRDLEFTHFAPTALAASARVHLPGEPLVELGAALRRAGARIVDDQGRPVLDELGPLDSVAEPVLAMAIHDARSARGGSGLFLDARGIGAQSWGLYPYLATARACREQGVDPVSAPLPIRPAAQSLVGGIAADADGETEVPGLFAAGEVSCTGALGAGGAADAQIAWALVSGISVGSKLSGAPLPSCGAPVARESEGCSPASTLPGIRTASEGALGLSREHERLRKASDFLARLPGDDDFGELGLTATNLRAVGAAMAAAAIARPETRGWHRRIDHPQSSPKWERTIRVACDASGTLHVTSSPVAS